MIYFLIICVYLMMLSWMWGRPNPVKMGVIKMAQLNEAEQSSEALSQFISQKSKDNIVFLEESALLKVGAQEIKDYTEEFKTFYMRENKL